MAENKPQQKTSEELSDIEHIQARPSMYVGSRGFSGLVRYMVSVFDLLLIHGATWLEIEVAKSYRVSSDALVPVRLNDRNELEPFEAIDTPKPSRYWELTVLTALSWSLRAAIDNGETATTLVTQLGKRQSFEQRPSTASVPSIALEFQPYFGTFSGTTVSPSVIHSYCRRNSCLHPNVLFRVKADGNVTEYRSVNGLRDYFDAVTMPYEIVHKPIHICERDDVLAVETIFVFHNWSENHIWSFANKGRVPDGGTHEAGLVDAIARLDQGRRTSAVGVLAVLAIEYPHVTLEGSIKSRVGNPELRQRVCNLITDGLIRWCHDNEDEVEYIRKIERFQFAAVW